MKKYNCAPLPFQGQKRNFINKFRESLDEFPADAIYVDLFGGSGILSHTIKAKYPNAKVVYNDFDNYSKRLQNIDKTNELIEEIRKIVKEIPNKFRIPTEIKNRILEVVKSKDYVDYITLSSNILFSGNYANSFEELEKATFYNRTTKKVYDVTDYLTGVDVVCQDYRELYDKYKDIDNVVFILDPPYLSTDVKSYNKAEFWKLTDYLNILKLLENKNFFYFTSNKGQLVELCEWLDFEYGCSPFKGCTTTTTTNQINHSSGYTDIMIYKSAV
ncbi:DNA methyltransferase [Empedobacter brevis]|uniref:DNA adenine methylase n=1 Tax=Empedobacter brevis TaxID=247 RepID=UPI00131F872D|nr:DNA adenine methylase [Empedobacter brevis]QHC84991.1 DNA methyltransferase [Empedobacter brevis]